MRRNMATETNKQDSKKITVSVIKADIGGWVGHSAIHPDYEEVGRPLGQIIGGQITLQRMTVYGSNRSSCAIR
jgi:uncharacterized protein YcfJ